MQGDLICSNSRVLGYGLLGSIMWYIDNLNGYSKTCKISVSAMEGLLVGRREWIHSGVLNW